MKVTRIKEGIYKIVDLKGTWIAKGGYATVNKKWTAFECDKEEDCSNENNWAIEFKTFAQLKKYSQSF